MNDALASYVIEAIYNAQQLPTPDTIRTYLIEPMGTLESRPQMYYRMMATLEEAVRENRAIDALNIFNLIWWDINVFFAQHILDLVRDMTADPDDEMGAYTVIHLSHTIVERFPTLT